MEHNYSDVKLWRSNTKKKLVEGFGGSCGICKIQDDQCIFDFHHIDPAQKDFQISSRIKTWDKIVAEALKCCMLCVICHRKLHKGLIKVPAMCPAFNESLVITDPLREAANRRRSPALALLRICPKCGEPKHKTATLCMTCSELRPQIAWNELDLAKMLDDHNGVVSRLARTLGISSPGLKRQLVKRGL